LSFPKALVVWSNDPFSAYLHVVRRAAMRDGRGHSDSLEDDVERVVVAAKAKILDDTGMVQASTQFNLAHELLDFIFLHALQSDALDGDHLASVEVEGAIDRAILTTANAIAKLLLEIYQLTSVACNSGHT
jgi:hypothetical protein